MPDTRQQSAATRILVVDDEKSIQKFLGTVLAAEGFAVRVSCDGETARSDAVFFRPELVLLDLGLPDIDGIELLRELREWSQVPVIVLSVRDREDDKVRALDAGADDYLTKPFGVAELLARIRVALRRGMVQTPEPLFNSGGLNVDLSSRSVSLEGAEIQLTPTEYDLLRLLVTHAGKVVTHNQILGQVWGEDQLEQTQLLRVTISNLRHKIEPEPSRPRYIITEPGVGYKLRVIE